MQEKKALSSRGRGRLRGFLELRHPWGFSPEARRGSQGASRTAPGKSGLHVRGEGVRVISIEPWKQIRLFIPLSILGCFHLLVIPSSLESLFLLAFVKITEKLKLQVPRKISEF